jgi:hypothetical protein
MILGPALGHRVGQGDADQLRRRVRDIPMQGLDDALARIAS